MSRGKPLEKVVVTGNFPTRSLRAIVNINESVGSGSLTPDKTSICTAPFDWGTLIKGTS